jgi:hypothetical protein
VPEGSHALGWEGLPPVPADGTAWPLEVAAKLTGLTERDLRDLVRIVDLQPVGTIRMAQFRRQGRNPRAYDASKLLTVCETVRKLRLDL